MVMAKIALPEPSWGHAKMFSVEIATFCGVRMEALAIKQLVTNFPKIEGSRYKGFIGASGGKCLPRAKLKTQRGPFPQDSFAFGLRPFPGGSKRNP